MRYYHFLLSPLEKKLQRPLLLYCSTVRHFDADRNFIDAHVHVPMHHLFWSRVQEQYPQWESLAKKWGAFRIEKAICPEFRDPASLICWAYELFLGVQLPVESVSLVLEMIQPTPMEWEQRISDWEKEHKK